MRKDLVYTDDDGVKYGLKGYSLQPDGEILDFGKTQYNSNGELCYSVEVNGDAKYYAVWEKIYAVNFRSESGIQTVYYYEGETLADRLPQLPEKEGYTGARIPFLFGQRGIATPLWRYLPKWTEPS